MPILIGDAPGSDFRNPLGLLTDCHRRLENFLKVLRDIVDNVQGKQLTLEHRQALGVSLRYFRESAPKHTADEEESLFPRLLRSKTPQAERISAVIAALQDDHRALDDRHKEIDELGCRWLADDRLGPRDLDWFSALLGEVIDAYRRHIATEESEIFPAAPRILTVHELEAIADEMARRRGLQIGKSRKRT